MTGKQNDPTRRKNEGEGSRSAARSYNRDARDFAKSGKVREAAKQAMDALAKDKKELQEAEDKGRDRAREFDPAVKR